LGKEKTRKTEKSGNTPALDREVEGNARKIESSELRVEKSHPPAHSPGEWAALSTLDS
jgi:hypothetical protein